MGTQRYPGGNIGYRGASRIISDIINDLSLRPNPGAYDSNPRYLFSYISSALYRVERLSMIAEINKLELKSCLYFRVTLNSLFLILLNKAHMNWISEMT